MGFFSRDKEDKEKLTPREMHEMIEQLKEEGRQKMLREKLVHEKPISDSTEYADFNEIMSKMKQTLKPVEDGLKNDLNALEKPIAREVVRVENVIKKDLSMIRVPKELKSKLRQLRQGKENYAETIERLINHA